MCCVIVWWYTAKLCQSFYILSLIVSFVDSIATIKRKNLYINVSILPSSICMYLSIYLSFTFFRSVVYSQRRAFLTSTDVRWSSSSSSSSSSSCNNNNILEEVLVLVLAVVVV